MHFKLVEPITRKVLSSITQYFKYYVSRFKKQTHKIRYSKVLVSSFVKQLHSTKLVESMTEKNILIIQYSNTLLIHQESYLKYIHTQKMHKVVFFYIACFFKILRETYKERVQDLCHERLCIDLIQLAHKYMTAIRHNNQGFLRK